jgi:hypothetical protein
VQALGRCIRHQKDYGSIILLDERLQEARPQRSLSKWLRDSVVIPFSFHDAHARLDRFFSDRADEAAVASAAAKADALNSERVEPVACGKGGCGGASREEAVVCVPLP